MHQLYTTQYTDENKDSENFLDLVSHMPCETVWAMYSCASGLVRDELEIAIRHLIKQGNTALSVKFPEFLP